VVFTSSSTGDVDNLENGGTGSLSQVTSFDAIKTYSTADTDTAIGSDPTVSDLADWINSLGVNVSASLVANDTTGSSWTLMIQSTDTGIANAISSISGGGDISFTSKQAAADAAFSINNLSFTRSSNTVSDIVEGVTFDLFETTDAATVRVKNSTTDSSSIIQSIVTTYNDLMETYKAMTANSSSKTPGNFADRPTTLSFINDIKTKFARGAHYGTDYGSNFSLSWLGVDMQLDGTLKFDEANYTAAVNDGLQNILAKGVIVGYSTSETRKSTVSFSDLDAGETFVFAGLTFVAGSSGASAAKVASAFADGTTGRSDGDYIGSVGSPETVTNGTIYGTLTDWDIGSYSAALGTVMFTSVRDTGALKNDGSGSTVITTKANGLLSYLDGYAGINGYIEDLINNEATIAYSLADRQDQLQTRLDSIQQNLINQYSALNALLFQLSSTSTSLASVLDSLNSNNN
jgi:flagellar hook-associated protein 2